MRWLIRMNPSEEIWRPCYPPFAERYEVSNHGNVRRRWNGKLLKLQFNRFANGKPGYVKVVLACETARKFVSVHRLVATAFVSGDSDLDVNHKDMNKTNNLSTNLEWVTHAENIRKGMAASFEWRDRLRIAGMKNRRPVIAVEPDGTETRYDSLNYAARTLGNENKAANIKHAIDQGSTAYARLWRYE